MALAGSGPDEKKEFKKKKKKKVVTQNRRPTKTASPLAATAQASCGLVRSIDKKNFFEPGFDFSETSFNNKHALRKQNELRNVIFFS